MGNDKRKRQVLDGLMSVSVFSLPWPHASLNKAYLFVRENIGSTAHVLVYLTNMQYNQQESAIMAVAACEPFDQTCDQSRMSPARMYSSALYVLVAKLAVLSIRAVLVVL